MKKRIVSLLLAVLMVTGTFPVQVFAADENISVELESSEPTPCDICGNEVCTCESTGEEGEQTEEPVEEEKYAKLASSSGVIVVAEGTDLLDDAIGFYYDEFEENTIFLIKDSYVADNEGIWYKVELYSGGVKESVLEEFGLAWPEEAWVLYDYTDESYDFEATLVFVERCKICGEPGCETEHVKCEVCGEYDCKKEHVKCEVCGEYDCETEHVPSISATVTDSNGNEQTVTVSGEALPEGAELSVSLGTQEQIDAFGGSSENCNLYVYNFELIKDGISLQPDGKVKVTISNLDLYEDGYVNIVHILDDADAIRRGIDENTAYPLDESSIVNAFPTEAALAEEISSASGIVYIEEFSTSDNNVTVSKIDNSISFYLTSFSSVAAANGNITASGTSTALYDGSDISLYVLPGANLTFTRKANIMDWRLSSTSNGVTGKVDSNKDYDLSTSNKSDNWSVSDHTATVTINVAKTATGKVTLYSYRGLNSSQEAKVNITVVTDAVSYNANGGSGAPGSQTKYHGENLTLSSTRPTRSGYTFLGWQSSADNKTYQPGETYSANQATVMTAIWGVSESSGTWNKNFYVLPGTTTFSEHLKKIDGATYTGSIGRPNIVADSNTYYVVPGTTMTFERTNGSWRVDSSETGITTVGTSWTNSDTVTVSVNGSAAEGTTLMLYSKNITGTTVNCARIIVATEEDVTTKAINDAQNIYRVGLYIICDSTDIPGEPNYTSGVSMINVNGGMSYKANGIGTVKPDIADSAFYINSLDGSCTMGVVSYTGKETIPFIDESLLNDAMDRVIKELDNASGATMTAADGKNLRALYIANGEDYIRDNYAVRPHIVKLMTGLSYTELGWHIDCTIYPLKTITLTYNLNPPAGYVLKNQTGFDGTPAPSVYTGDSDTNDFTVTESIAANTKIKASVSGATDEAELTFTGWNTKPDGTGTFYAPGGTVTTSADVTLYAQWTGGHFTTGTLKISKKVTVASDSIQPNSGEKFTFAVTELSGGTYNYKKYNSSSGALVSSGTTTNGTFELQDGQFVEFAGVPVQKYTVKETLPENYTNANATQTLTLRGGYVNELTFNNVFNKRPNFNITFDFNGGTNTNSKYTVTYGSTNYYKVDWLNPNRTGYSFAGWFTAEGTQVYTKDGYCIEGDYWNSDNKWIGTSDLTVYAHWTANTDTAYTVNHYKQNLDGNYPTNPTETENLTGETNAEVTPAVKSYTGFTAPAAQTVTIAADGSTVVNYYYTRNEYTVTFTINGNTYIGPNKVTYGETITVPGYAVPEGHTFSGWTVPATMPAENITLDATLTANKYTVTFTINGEVYGDPIEVVYGGTITIPEYTVPEGHTFSGWTVPATMPAGNQTYNATLTVNQYTITFNTDGGTEIAPIKQNYNTTVNKPADPIKEGYTFKGWDKEIPETMQAEDMTITAQWTINQYTITFDTVGGTEIAPIKQNYNTTVNKPADPTKEGYTFAGWDKTIPTTMPAENVTITAKWTINQYTITFDLNGGNIDGKTDDVIKNQYYNTAVTAPANPTKTGYTFAGWAPALPEKMPAENITVKAQWTVNKYTVTLVYNEEQVTVDNTRFTKDSDGWKKVFDYNSIINLDFDPILGYRITGVTINGVPLGTEVNGIIDNYAIHVDTKFEVTSEPIEYTITFDTDGGTEIAPITQAYKTAVNKPADPTKTGYTFKGWSPEVPATMPAENITVKAQWEINEYTITFDTDGGSDVDPITQNYGTTVTAPANPTKEGYTFTGWSPSVPTTMPAENITVKAQWEINQYTITWLNDDGTLIDTTTVDHGKVPTHADPNKAATAEFTYTFTGWTPTVVAATENAEYKATYSSATNVYTVTWKNEDGTVLETDENVPYGTTPSYNGATPTKAPTVEQTYEFDGWSPVVSVVTGDATYFASYTPHERTYEVIWKNYDGTVLETDEVAYNNMPEYNGEVPQKAGDEQYSYSFAGWSPTVAVVNGNAEYMATFTQSINQYTLSIEIDRGTGESKTVDYGSEVTVFATPETGYTVNSYQVDGGEVKEASSAGKWGFQVLKLVSNKHVKVTTRPIVYTITYNGLEGAVIDENPAKYTIESDNITLNNPTKVGYTFAGWTGTGLSEATKDVTISQGSTGNREYTANWTANDDTEYKVEHWQQNIDAEDEHNDTNFTLTDTDKLTGTTAEEVTPAVKSYTGFTAPAAQTVEITADGNTVVKYYYTRNKYTIKFVDGEDEDTVYLKKELAYGSGVTAPADPTKTGYTFAGWDKTIPNTMPAEDMIITAKWTVNQYTITFNTDGGNEIAPIKQNYGTAVTAPADPTKEGYTFAGWDKEIPNTMPAGDMIITAKWTINQYTITFNTDGGNEIAPIKQNYNTAVTKPADPTKTGYTFAGWDKDIPKNMPAEDMTITAKWTINQYTITFNTDGGNEIAPIKQNYGTAVTAPEDPTKEGYTFAGWDKDIPKNMPAGDMTITAQWTINRYTITFDTVGGTAIDAITQNYNTAVTAPEDPTKEGYTFAGWDIEIPNTMPAGDMIITAKWTVNQYTITFNTDGGNEIAPIKQNYNTAVTAPANPTKTGYTFAGWDKTIPNTMPAEDMIITAKWTINQYTITFDTDGGTAIDAITQDYNTEVTKPADPTKTGYTFAGWDTEIPENMPAENVTITANWTINQYTITFDTDGGTEIAPIKQDYNTAVTAPADPTKTGYTFKGWSPDVPATMPAENITVKAQWERSLVDLTIKTKSDNSEQSFIFTVTGTPSDESYGTVTLEVVLVGTDAITIKNLPVGIYTVTEKDGWSWRESTVGSIEADITTGSKTVEFVFGAVDNVYWLSGYSYNKRRKGKEQ